MVQSGFKFICPMPKMRQHRNDGDRKQELVRHFRAGGTETGVLVRVLAQKPETLGSILFVPEAKNAQKSLRGSGPWSCFPFSFFCFHKMLNDHHSVEAVDVDVAKP